VPAVLAPRTDARLWAELFVNVCHCLTQGKQCPRLDDSNTASAEAVTHRAYSPRVVNNPGWASVPGSLRDAAHVFLRFHLATGPLGCVLVGVMTLWMLGCATPNRSGHAASSAQQAASASEEPAENVVRIEPPSGQPSSPLPKVVAPLAKLPEGAVKALEPSNDRVWSPDMARLAYAEFDGGLVAVHNIRNCDYRTADDYTVRYYDKTFDLNKLESVDFIVVPFLASPGLAHVMVSFGFQGDDYLGLSVEIRRENGEKYFPLNGVLRQFELIYVIGDERDLIKQCTDVYLNGVYVYRSRLTRQEGRALFVDVMRRANQLAQQPEFYHTFTNNCTTNIVRHVNRLGTRKLPFNQKVLLPGHFDELLYEQGLIATDAPSFEQARLRARVNRLAYLYADSPDYSARLRE